MRSFSPAERMSCQIKTWLEDKTGNPSWPSSDAMVSNVRTFVQEIKTASQSANSFTFAAASQTAPGSNWATFAQALDLPGCKQRLHMPFLDPRELPCELAIIFRATSTEMGVLMLSRKLQEQDLAGTVLGGTMDPVMFPV